MERILGVAIGLAVTYLFLSVLVLALAEAISGVLALRAEKLRQGLSRILMEGSAGLEGRSRAFFKHPLIATLGYASGRRSDLPSYLPTPLFVKAFLDNVGDLRAKGAAINDAYQAALAELPPEAQVYVRGIVGQTLTTVEDAEQRVSQWFDASMQRLSGEYRRNIQWIARGIAVAVVFAMNANTLHIGATFWRDPVAREAASKFATTALERCESEYGAAAAPAAPAAPIDPTAPAAAAPTARTAAMPLALPKACPGLLDEAAESLPLPLGWTSPAWHAIWQSAGSCALTLFGLLLTVIAVSFGAPFWFDLLRKVIPSLSLAGPRPKAGMPPERA
jgi:hypothetical protein